jgi:hypothetical protein
MGEVLQAPPGAAAAGGSGRRQRVERWVMHAH